MFIKQGIAKHQCLNADVSMVQYLINVQLSLCAYILIQASVCIQ